MAHIEEFVPGVDRGEYVDAAVTRGLRERGEADLLENTAQLKRGGHRIREVRSRLGVEIDSELVGIVGV